MVGELDRIVIDGIAGRGMLEAGGMVDGCRVDFDETVNLGLRYSPSVLYYGPAVDELSLDVLKVWMGWALGRLGTAV